jgi:hypothetical protein
MSFKPRYYGDFVDLLEGIYQDVRMLLSDVFDIKIIDNKGEGDRP